MKHLINDLSIYLINFVPFEPLCSFESYMQVKVGNYTRVFIL